MEHDFSILWLLAEVSIIYVLIAVIFPNPLPWSNALSDFVFSVIVVLTLLIVNIVVASCVEKFHGIMPAKQTLARMVEETCSRDLTKISHDIARLQSNALTASRTPEQNEKTLKDIQHRLFNLNMTTLKDIQSRLTALEEVDHTNQVDTERSAEPVPQPITASPTSDILEGKDYTNAEANAILEAQTGLRSTFDICKKFTPETFFEKITPRQEDLLRLIRSLEIEFPDEPLRRTTSALTGRWSGGSVREIIDECLNSGLLTCSLIQTGKRGKPPEVYTTTKETHRLFNITLEFPPDGGEETRVIIEEGRKKAWENGHRIVIMHTDPNRLNQPDALEIPRVDSRNHNFVQTASIEVTSTRKILQDPHGIFIDLVKNFRDGYVKNFVWFRYDRINDTYGKVKTQFDRLPSWLKERVVLLPLDVPYNKPETSLSETKENTDDLPEWYKSTFSNDRYPKS